MNPRRVSRAVLVLGLVILGAAAIRATQAPVPGRSAAITDGQTRLAAFDRVKDLAARSPFRSMSWQFVGPTNISGRVTDVAVVTPRGRSYTMWVATATGGVWKTENDGVTWLPVFEHEATASIGALAIAPNDPNVVWVGTGECNIFRSSNAGTGLYKTADGGKTWAHMGLADTFTIARILIHPTNPDIVYVAASGHEWTDHEARGVYKTSDGGKTWTRILSGNTRTGAIDLVMDPTDPHVLYAAMWQRVRQKWSDPRHEAGYTGSGVHKTRDGGKTWVAINEGLPAAAHRGRIGLDLARSNPNVIYAFVDSYDMARQPNAGEVDAYGRPRAAIIKGAEVYRSDNKGASWRKVSESGAFMERAAGTYGWVFGQLRVDPLDENTVYLMGLGLNVSRDGGRTFEELKGMHSDHHALWIDPANPNFLVNGNDGGVVVSYDRGKTWRSHLDNLPAVQFFNVAFDMETPFHVYGSIQDHGSRRGVIDLTRGRGAIPAVAFEEAPGGEGTRHAIDPSNPHLVYSAGFYHNMNRTDLSKRDARGRPLVKNITPRLSPADGPLRGQWLTGLLMSPHNSDVIYYGGQYVFRSWNRGDTWERISPDLTRNDPGRRGDIPFQTIYALQESPMRFGLLYAGTDDGRLHVTVNGGDSWTDVTAGLAPDRWIAKVAPSAFDETTVYVAQNGKRDDDFAPYLWKSVNAGKTWTNIAAGIPLGPINVITEDPTNPKLLYVGTDGGVFVTLDGGVTWDVLGGNLPTNYVHDLVVHPRDRVIVAATHGRGLWAMDAIPVQGFKK